MKLGKIKTVFLAFLCALTLSALCSGLFMLNGGFARAEEGTEYSGAYRNRLAFSALEHWNNDPNGLLYIDGVWHMYYQYNFTESYEDWEDPNAWGHMSWGHATSTDLVHWEEKAVALPEGKDGYAMMFSGSAVYDEYNSSGLFDTDASGKVVEGQGIVAVLTQPKDDIQRQILAFSKDGGDSFEIYGEILGAAEDGEVGDNEFRDPKVFWSERHNKWLLAVGGGSVRMYSSSNLKKWEYLGATGYWGECPDISRYVVDGEEKYVLIISPEDKDQSHKYNRTNRADTYYPAEYYVVGDLNEEGLFISSEPIRRLSEGIDSYAFQSFNNSPDGKVYGVSWSASWKTCGLYGGFRKTYNGGMTVVTELNLVKEGEGYVLTRTPVDGYKELRSEKIGQYSGKLASGANALADIALDVADLEIELDFNSSSARYVELWLRVSAVERIKLCYDVAGELLTLDRSQSSLLASQTALYTVPYSKRVELNDGKLSLRILLDRAFVSVFANGGKASFFSAVFPSAISNGMSLTADGDIGVNAAVYSLNGIFNQTDGDELIVTTAKIDGVVGKVYPVIASSFASNFTSGDVKFTVGEKRDGGDIALRVSNGIAYITPLSKGYVKLAVSYKGQSQDIDIYIYNNGWVSNIDYIHSVSGFSFYGDNGLFLSDERDGFRFSDTKGKEFIYSAEFTPENDSSQAAGLIFATSDNLTSYLVATADLKDNKVKLWQAGVGDLKTADYSFEAGKKFKITVIVNAETARIYIGEDKIAAITYKIENYSGGKLGINVYNGGFNINNVKFTPIDTPDGDIYVGGYEVLKVVNLTDGNYKLESNEYSVKGGVLTISQDYLKTLEAEREYSFRVVTSFTEFTFKVVTDFTSVTATPSIDKFYRKNDVTIELSASVAVHKVTIDGRECAFTQTDDRVVIPSAEISSLSIGEHKVVLFTDKGRPETTINVSEMVETVTEPEVKSNHVWLWIDLSIFAAAIIGYITYSIVKKHVKK